MSDTLARLRIFRPMQRHLHGAAGLLIAVVLLSSVLFSTAAGQSKDREKDRDRKDDSSPKQLETRLTKAEESLLKEYLDVANEYYKQGDKQASIDVLRRVEAINPRMDGLKERITGLEEELLQENGLKLDLDVSKGWIPLCEVEKGRALRISATGDYKLTWDATIPVTGLASGDPANDYVTVGSLGALIGVIVTGGKPGDPFAISSGAKLEPKDSGQLFVRVNAPATARCKGDLKIQASGAIRPLSKKKTD